MESTSWSPSAFTFQRRARRSGSRYGSCSRSTAWMTANTEELAASARARVATARATKPLRACSERTAALRSCSSASMSASAPASLRGRCGTRLLNFRSRKFDGVDESAPGERGGELGEERRLRPGGEWLVAPREPHHQADVHVGELAKAEAGFGPQGRPHRNQRKPEPVTDRRPGRHDAADFQRALDLDATGAERGLSRLAV